MTLPSLRVSSCFSPLLLYLNRYNSVKSFLLFYSPVRGTPRFVKKLALTEYGAELADYIEVVPKNRTVV